jgi:hypothetical protein
MIVSIINYYCMFYLNSGFYIPYNLIVYCVTISLCLVWLVFLLSIIILKKAFINTAWENTFIFVSGFSTLLQLIYGGIMSFTSINMDHNAAAVFSDYYNNFIFLYGMFFELLLVFLIAYLIQFIIRLVRH